MATFASANDFAAGSAPDTMLAAVANAKGAPTVRMDVVWRNLRRLQTREFMSQWNTQKTAGAIPIRVHRTERAHLDRPTIAEVAPLPARHERGEGWGEGLDPSNCRALLSSPLPDPLPTSPSWGEGISRGPAGGIKMRPVNGGGHHTRRFARGL